MSHFFQKNLFILCVIVIKSVLFDLVSIYYHKILWTNVLLFADQISLKKSEYHNKAIVEFCFILWALPTSICTCRFVKVHSLGYTSKESMCNHENSIATHVTDVLHILYFGMLSLKKDLRQP